MLTSTTGAYRFRLPGFEKPETHDDESRVLFFMASSTDDRHNPNVNTRNTTNPPGLPIFSTKPTKKPISRPTTRPTSKPSRKPSAKPSKRPTARPSRKPTARPTNRPTTKPTARPTNRPTKKPTARPSSRPTARPTAKPTARPTITPSLVPSSRPTRKPISKPTRKPSRIPSSKPSRRPSRAPTTKTRKPSVSPTYRPTRRPTVRRTRRPIAQPTRKPTKLPTSIPTSLPTINVCARDHFGTFGNTSTKNYIFIPYNYEMVTNITTVSIQNTTIDIVRDVEYAITDLLLRNLFSQCASYYAQKNKMRWLAAHRHLESGEIIGITSTPNDIPTGDICDVPSLLPESVDGNNNNIFSSNADPSAALSCVVLKGQLSIFVDGALMADIVGLESLWNLSRSLIKDGMNGGELALANDAIVILRYLDDTEKILIPLAAVVAPIEKNQNTVLWALLGLLLLLLLLLLALLRRFKRKKKEKEAFQSLENYKDTATIRAYDLEGLSDISSVHLSFDSDVGIPQEKKVPPPPVPPKKSRVVPPMKHKEEAPPPTHVRKLTPLQIAGLEDFLENRFTSDDEEEPALPKIPPRIVPQKSRYVPPPPYKLAPVKREEKVPLEEDSVSSEDESILPEVIPLAVAQKSRYIPSGSPKIIEERKKHEHETVELKPVPLVTRKVSPPPPEEEAAYTYEAMGTNRGVTPKCSICYKDADGWMRSCQCGNKSCDKVAHAACIYGRNPTPSLSYPGTPPPIMPPVLCGPENSWMEKRRRASSCDEENLEESTIPNNRSFDDTVYAQGALANGGMGIMGCIECRYEDTSILRYRS